MHGFYNKYLYINLKDKTYREKKLSDGVLAANLGGKGLATHLLLENLAPGTDPLSPEQIAEYEAKYRPSLRSGSRKIRSAF